MRGDVSEDLLWVRRRTLLHLAAKRAPVEDRDFVAPESPSEDQHAEAQPTGASLAWVLAVLSGLAGSALCIWGPRIVRFAWAVLR